MFPDNRIISPLFHPLQSSKEASVGTLESASGLPHTVKISKDTPIINSNLKTSEDIEEKFYPPDSIQRFKTRSATKLAWANSSSEKRTNPITAIRTPIEIDHELSEVDEPDETLISEPSQVTEDITLLFEESVRSAHHLQEQRQKEFMHVKAALEYIEKNKANLKPEEIEKLKKWMPVVEDYASKAKKYLTFIRTAYFLTLGNTDVKEELQKTLASSKHTISNSWTSEELKQEFETIENEPWNNTDSHDPEVKRLASEYAALYYDSQSACTIS